MALREECPCDSNTSFFLSSLFFLSVIFFFLLKDSTLDSNMGVEEGEEGEEEAYNMWNVS